MHKRLEDIMAADIGQAALRVPLAPHSSWRIGGPADLLVEPDTVVQVATLMRLCNQFQVPLVVIGQGTNLLFDDAGVRGVVMKIGGGMAHLETAGEEIVAGGGVWVPQLARTAMRAGFAGLEHCIGIPGTVGGLVVMNGGSQRRAIAEQIVTVTVVDTKGSIRDLTAEQCQFGYRTSVLQGRGDVVVAVTLHCARGDRRQIRREMLADLKQRREKFPLKQPNCGSVFLSTTQMHATVGPPGKIIEEAGLKGSRFGRVEVSQQHANFIVNLGGASSAEVLQLIARIRTVIHKRLDFDLCCEVRYVSPEGVVAPAHLALERLSSL